MFCEQCGSKIQEGLPFCDRCGAPVENIIDEEILQPVRSQQPTRQEIQARMSSQSADRSRQSSSRPRAQQPERQPRQRPQQQERMVRQDVKYRNGYEEKPLGGLKLSENEVVVKRYHCATTGAAEGYLSVTSKRMIFHSESGKGMFYNRVAKEISLDNVSGIESYYGTHLSWGRIVIAIILIILAFSTGNLGIAKHILGKAGMIILSVILLILAALLIKSAVEKNFTFKVYASDCSPSPISLGLGALSGMAGFGVFQAVGLGNNSMMTFMGWSAEDTDAMMDELGALVHDLQTMGDLAVQKWKE